MRLGEDSERWRLCDDYFIFNSEAQVTKLITSAKERIEVVGGW
jgi:hypothetical protein